MPQICLTGYNDISGHHDEEIAHSKSLGGTGRQLSGQADYLFDLIMLNW